MPARICRFCEVKLVRAGTEKRVIEGLWTCPKCSIVYFALTGPMNREPLDESDLRDAVSLI